MSLHNSWQACKRRAAHNALVVGLLAAGLSLCQAGQSATLPPDFSRCVHSWNNPPPFTLRARKVLALISGRLLKFADPLQRVFVSWKSGATLPRDYPKIYLQGDTRDGELFTSLFCSWNELLFAFFSIFSSYVKTKSIMKVALGFIKSQVWNLVIRRCKSVFFYETGPLVQN